MLAHLLGPLDNLPHDWPGLPGPLVNDQVIIDVLRAVLRRHYERWEARHAHYWSRWDRPRRG